MTVETARYAQSLTAKPVKGMLTGPVTILQWSFVRDDQPLIAELMSAPTGVTGAAATLNESLGRDPAITEVADALAEALRERADVAAEPFDVDDRVQAEFAGLRASYADESWTWRR